MNRMAFFRKWKNSARHQKLSEEWALATSLKDLSECQDDNDFEPMIFSVKYLGYTSIEAARSEEATADAIKDVINLAKTGGKKLQRVNLAVSPRGIEVLDQINDEAVLRVSIYNISYCSADATHSQVFAFVSSEVRNSGGGLQEPQDVLTCHAFLCQKRKVAESVTLEVARCFERAYQSWRITDERKAFERIERKNGSLRRKAQSDAKTANELEQSLCNADSMRCLLIDLSSASELCGKSNRDLLQNTWVSFEEGNGGGHEWQHNLIVS